LHAFENFHFVLAPLINYRIVFGVESLSIFNPQVRI